MKTKPKQTTGPNPDSFGLCSDDRTFMGAVNAGGQCILTIDSVRSHKIRQINRVIASIDAIVKQTNDSVKVFQHSDPVAHELRIDGYAFAYAKNILEHYVERLYKLEIKE